MADGLLSNIFGAIDRSKQSAMAKLGLLANNPQEYLAQINEGARDFNRGQEAGLLADRNQMRGLPITPEQQAAQQYANQQLQDLALGFAGNIKPVKPLNNPLNTLERMAPFYINYPKASGTVDNLKVGEKIKNMDSISATFNKYEIDKGIRSIPISEFQVSKPNELFRSSDDIKRVNELAKQIKANKYIDPLIVAIDKEGTYVLEGGHRLGALNLLGVKNLPAVVVRDLDY